MSPAAPAKRKLLVCQHVAHEILGTLNPLFKRAGFRIRYVNFGRHPHAEPGLEGYGGLVLLGGPMSVNDVQRHPHLATEMRLVERALEREIPVLGICLGAQLIARALGANVRANGAREIGWHDVHLTEAGQHDPMLSHFAATERVFHWHGDTFDMPHGAVHLARSALCAHQGFRYGRKVYGLQFHLEVDERLIERWLAVPAHRQEMHDLPGVADTIRRDTPRHIDRLKQLSAAVFGSFVTLFAARRRRVVHPSR
jgi:GMP synthase (glutamine-hydrolysing)